MDVRNARGRIYDPRNKAQIDGSANVLVVAAETAVASITSAENLSKISTPQSEAVLS